MSSAASTQPRSIVVRMLRRFLRQPAPKLEFERKLSLDLAALLGDDSVKPRWLKPLDVSSVLARYGIDPRTTPHCIDATGAACTDSSALPQCDAILATFAHARLAELDDALAARGFNRAADCSAPDAPHGTALYVRRPLVAMSSLDKKGRFANQLFKYLFMRILAKQHGAVLQVSDWAGAHLYGLDEPTPLRALEQYDESRPRACRRASLRKTAPERMLAGEVGGEGEVADADFQGYFQFDARHYAPHQEFAREVFTLAPQVQARLDRALAKLREGGSEAGSEAGSRGGREVIAVHLRRGDYGRGYFFRTPCAWYEQWLASLCAERGLDPARVVVYLASEDPERYRGRFKPFHTVTARDVSDMPPALDWLLDFEVMRAADRLAIANSSFSFMAAFLNPRITRAMRPSIARMGLVEFDPRDGAILDRKRLSRRMHARLAALD